MTRLIPLLAVLMAIAACKKDGSSKTSLIGKWKQIEFYNGSVPGGCNCWTPVNELTAEKIEFRSNRTFQRTASPISSVAYCPGTYKIDNDSTLTMNMDCTGAPVEITNWFSQEDNILIISPYIVSPGGGIHYKIKYIKE